MSKEQKNKRTIAIIGAGSWGLTLAWLFAQSENHILLYSGSKEKLDKLSKHHKLDKPVKVDFTQNKITFTDNLLSAVGPANVIIFCCTSQSMRDVAKRAALALKEKNSQAILLSAVKGLELDSLKRMSEVIEEELPDFEVCVLSGPNLAKEILQGLPTAAVIASRHASSASLVQKYLSVPQFRLYTNADVIGVELGGTLKNVIAIAAGCADGLNLGANAKAALITRGLAEISRLALLLGANPITLTGLAGMGDLLATCSSPLSRNYHLGLEMAKGKSLQSILEETGAVIEGITTTIAVCKLSQNLNIELPIAKLVQAFLDSSLTPSEAIMALMNRPLISE